MCTLSQPTLEFIAQAAPKQVRAKRHSFLATALIQATTVLERNIPALSMAEEL